MTLSVHIRHHLGAFALDIAFEAPPGITALFGRSGAGKTTIINTVAGLLRPETGRVAIDDRVLFDAERGVCLPAHQRRLGYIFQESRLFPHLSVAQNLVYGRWFQPYREPRVDRERIVDMLGIGALLARRPGELSAGERQRVAIGRALLAGPRLILADEPLAALDESRKAEILPYFERLRDEISIPILYVSHSAAEVARLATTVVAIEAGRVSGLGTASEVLGNPMLTPMGARAAGAVLQARVARHHSDGMTELDAGGLALFLPQIDGSVGKTLRLRVAAHDVMLARVKPAETSALNIIPGRILKIRHGDGPAAIVLIHTDAGELLARVAQRSVRALSLEVDVRCYAIINDVAIAPADVGTA